MSSIFPSGREILINYTWTDVATATGYILYDAWGTVSSTGTTYHLTPSNSMNTLFGSNFTPKLLASAGTAATSKAVYQKVTDIDFDTTEFQIPRTLEGTAILRLGGQFNESHDAANGGWQYFIVKIRKWNGAAETEIASIQSSTKAWTDDGEFGFNLAVEIPRTTIKKGEQIRVTIECWLIVASIGTAVNIALGHAPSDVATTVTWSPYTTMSISAGNSRLPILLPFKIEV